jgi:hypothetical protein
MLRAAIYAFGISAGFAAMMMYQERRTVKRPLPAKKAAKMLKKAWADHHTTA